MSFQISGLPLADFAPLFDLPDAELARRGIVRRIAVKGPAARFPCRVSLRDVESGVPVLLLNYEHLPTPGPYRSRYAIYVSERATEARLAVNEIPEVMRNRPLALRAFDRDGTLLEAELAEGGGVAATIERLLASPNVEFLHAHNAKAGCYAARVRRA